MSGLRWAGLIFFERSAQHNKNHINRQKNVMRTSLERHNTSPQITRMEELGNGIGKPAGIVGITCTRPVQYPYL